MVPYTKWLMVQEVVYGTYPWSVKVGVTHSGDQ